MITGDVNDPVLVAQPRALRTIERLLEEGRAHALLLSGSPGSGPVAAAQRVAQRVLCPNGGDDDCDVCGRISRRVHPDLMWIAPEGSDLAKPQIDLVVETTTRMPFEGVAQVVVLEGADSLSFDNRSAGNTLLKSLEEPEGRVVFVLLATSPARVLPTVRSRCVEVVFPAVPDALLVEALRADGVDEGVVAAATGMDLNGIARAARGDLSRAREIAAGDTAAQRRGDLLVGMHQVASGAMAPSQLANRIMSRAGAASDAAAARAALEFDEMELVMSDKETKTFNGKTNDEGREKRTARRARKARVAELQACLAELSSWWRDVLALSVGADEAVTNLDRLDQTRAAAAGPAGTRAVGALDAIDDSAARLLFNNADEGVTVGALVAELAALAAGRIRARRTLGAGARTPQGYEVSLG
ncbi:MAG: ATPase involved in replication [Thermoleophilia bacterium]|nr:ATPase involved in replication [Thermoleophilia bacterium]